MSKKIKLIDETSVNVTENEDEREISVASDDEDSTEHPDDEASVSENNFSDSKITVLDAEMGELNSSLHQNNNLDNFNESLSIEIGESSESCSAQALPDLQKITVSKISATAPKKIILPMSKVLSSNMSLVKKNNSNENPNAKRPSQTDSMKDITSIVIDEGSVRKSKRKRKPKVFHDDDDDDISVNLKVQEDVSKNVAFKEDYSSDGSNDSEIELDSSFNPSQLTKIQAKKLRLNVPKVLDYDSDDVLNNRSTSFSKLFMPKKNDQSQLDMLHKLFFNDVSDDENDVEKSRATDKGEALNMEYPSEVPECTGHDVTTATLGPENVSVKIQPTEKIIKVKGNNYQEYEVLSSLLGAHYNSPLLIPTLQGTGETASGSKSPVKFSHTCHPSGEESIHNVALLEENAQLKTKLRHYKDELKVLRKRYLELSKKELDSPRFTTVSDLLGGAAKFLNDDQLLLFYMQLKSNINPSDIRYSVKEKAIALALYQDSPKHYDSIRNMFGLPSKAALEKWLETVASQDPDLAKGLMYKIYSTYKFGSESTSKVAERYL